jgi:hypothetical protein
VPLNKGESKTDLAYWWSEAEMVQVVWADVYAMRDDEEGGLDNKECKWGWRGVYSIDDKEIESEDSTPN